MRHMAKAKKASSGSSSSSKSSRHGQVNLQKKKTLGSPPPAQRGGVELVDPRVQAQLKLYDEALAFFHQQKFARAKQELEKVLEGPSKELTDRARMHLKIAEQRMKPSHEQNPRTAEDHYQRGVAMMNIGRWDDARESLLKARKAAPKADHIHYALATLDCLTGEADSAMANLKVAIELRRRFRLPPGRSPFHRVVISGERRHRRLTSASPIGMTHSSVFSAPVVFLLLFVACNARQFFCIVYEHSLTLF
jgi:tetratricopeptide (TPR) repeat protein